MKKSLRAIAVRVIAILLLLSLSFTYFYFAAKQASAAWFDDGWRYRVAIPISAHTTLETNVYLALTGANGIDTSDTTKFQTDCGDIRFTDSSGNILPHYLTTACGLAQTGFNVFFDSFPAGAQTIYYYYGNSGVANGFSLQNFPVAATGVTLGSRGTETTAPVSPLIFWKMDEGYGQTVSNSISSSYSGTRGPDATTTSTDPSWEGEELCVSGKCLHFVSTSSQYVNVSSSVPSVKSIGFWVRPTSTTTSLVVLNGAAGNASLSATSGTLSAGAGFTTPTIYVNGVVSSTITANTWNYITVTTGTGITASNIMLGRVNTGYLNGFMDEIKLYGVTLTTSQIKANYAAGMGKVGGIKGASVSFGSGQTTKALSNGLSGYWKMDESSGNPVDSSGNSVTLTNNGTTPFMAGKFGNGAGTFNGSSRYFSTATSLSIQTVSFWVYPAATTDNFIHFASGKYISATTGTVSATGLTSPTIFVNGVQSSTIVANSWQHITVVDTSAITATAFEVGRANGAYMANNSIIDEVRVYSTALSSIDVQQLTSWSSGPIGYWKMDENTGSEAQDSSGYAFSSTMMGDMGGANWAPGIQGSSLSFDGVNDHIDIYSTEFNAAFNPSHGALSAWVRIPTSTIWADTSTNRAIVQLAEDTSNLITIRKTTTPNQIAFVYTAGGVTVSGTYSTSRTDWFKVSIVWDKLNDKADYYVDGVRIDSDTGLGTWSGTGLLGATRANIGSRLSDGTDPFQGFIDEVQVYNYPISSSTLVSHMTGDAVAYWKCDEGGSTTIHDSNGTNGGLENLTISSSVGAWTTAGKFGSAFYPGGSRWATISDTTSLDFSAQEDISISFWMQSSLSSGANPSATEYIINKPPSSATNGGYAVYANTSGNICFGIDDDNSSFPEDETCSSLDLYDNAWHHIIALKTGVNTLEVYIDNKQNGTPDSSLSSVANTLENSSSFYIGSSNAVNDTDDFNGYIDEIQIQRSTIIRSTRDTISNGGGALLGSNSQTTTHIGSRSTSSLYCVPGDTTSCSGPVGEWRLDEKQGTTSSIDTSGNANNMSFNGAIPSSSWTIGKNGAAIRLDGVNDYLSASENGLYESSNFTLETWVQFDALPSVTGENCTLLVKAHPTNPYYSYNWTVRTTNDMLIDWTNTAPTHYYSSSTTSINRPNVWYHLVVVKNGTSATHYINGINQTNYSDTMSGTTYNSSAGLWIGAGGAGTSQRCKAIFDESRMFDYARSPAQIAWDYNKGKPVGWYKLDECQGSSVYDSIGNATAGTITPGSAPNSTVGSCSIVDSAAMWYDGVDGKFNGSLGFDGTNDYVALGAQSALNSPQVSISAWINLTNPTDSASQEIYNRQNSSNIGTVALRKNTTNLYQFQFRLDGSESTIHDISSNATATTGWHHIVGTYNGSVGLLYIDGILQTDTEVSSGSIDTDTLNAIDLGRNPSGSNFLNGKIDDVQVYNYALTPLQILNIINNSSSVRFGPITGEP